MSSVFFNKGENCIAAGRLFVEDSIHDEFLERIVSFTLLSCFFYISIHYFTTLSSFSFSQICNLLLSSGVAALHLHIMHCVYHTCMLKFCLFQTMSSKPISDFCDD